MLDVHPPHEKVHGIKDFLLHVFTMTIGLFIALLLEGCVERHHKAELKRDAEENLRLEVQDNARMLAAFVPVMATEEARLKRVLDFIEASRAGKPYELRGDELGFTEKILRDASWRTASATGALSLLDYKQVQGYANLYQTQDEVMRLQRAALDDYLIVQSYAVYAFDPKKITPAQLDAGQPLVRNALAHLEATEQLAQGLTLAYQQMEATR